MKLFDTQVKDAKRLNTVRTHENEHQYIFPCGRKGYDYTQWTEYIHDGIREIVEHPV